MLDLTNSLSDVVNPLGNLSNNISNPKDILTQNIVKNLPKAKTENYLGYDIHVKPDGSATFISKQNGQPKTFRSLDEAKMTLDSESAKQKMPTNKDAQNQFPIPSVGGADTTIGNFAGGLEDQQASSTPTEQPAQVTPLAPTSNQTPTPDTSNQLPTPSTNIPVLQGMPNLSEQTSQNFEQGLKPTPLAQQTEPKKMDFNDFAEQIKEKYPVYKSMDNKDLAEQIIAKYPVYKDKVNFPHLLDDIAPQGTVWNNPLTRGVSDVIETGLTAVGDVGAGIANLSSKNYQGKMNALTGRNDEAMQFENPMTAMAKEGRWIAKNPEHTKAWQDVLQGASGLAEGAQLYFYPMANVVMKTAEETDTGKQLLANPVIGPIIGSVLGGLAGGWKGGLKGAGLGTMPVLVDSLVEKFGGDLSKQDRDRLKGVLVNGTFAYVGAKEGGEVNITKNAANGAKTLPENLGNTKENIVGGTGDLYDTAVTGLGKGERTGLQSNPYQAEEFNNMVTRSKSTEGIDDIKNYKTERVGEITDELTGKISEMEKSKGEDAQVYNTVRENKTPVPVDPLISDLQNTLVSNGLDIKDGVVVRVNGTKAGELNAADVSKFNQIYQDLKADANKQGGNLLPEQILDARKTASSMANYDGSTTSKGQYVMRTIRKNIDNYAKSNIEGLKDLDKLFADKLNDFKDATQDLVYKGGDMKGNFRSNIESIISNLDKPNRALLLKRLEEVMPGIGSRIEAINNLPKLHKALNDKGIFSKYTGISGALGGASIGGAVLPIIGHLFGGLGGYFLGHIVDGVLTKVKAAAIEKVISKTSPEGITKLKTILEKQKENIELSKAEANALEKVKQRVKDEANKSATVGDIIKNKIEIPPEKVTKVDDNYAGRRDKIENQSDENYLTAIERNKGLESKKSVFLKDIMDKKKTDLVNSDRFNEGYKKAFFEEQSKDKESANTSSYPSDLLTAFKNVFSSENRSGKQSVLDKYNKIEEGMKTNKQFQKFYDTAKAHIESIGSDKSVQELYNDMKDTVGGKKTVKYILNNNKFKKGLSPKK